MSHFNLVRVIRDDLYGVRGYDEVIETVRWGLHQLGHHTTASDNSHCAAATNILFGGHLSTNVLLAGPPDTIYYNLEQIRGNPQYNPDAPANTVEYIAANLQIWDYSQANIETWNRLRPRMPVRLLPICYAPILTRIAAAQPQDIGVLIYGLVGPRRLEVFSALGKLVNDGVAAVYASGLYGAARDALIARSKIVVNINHYDRSKIFEVVRVSYLLANAKAVVADISLDSFIESDIANGIALVPVEKIADTCWHLLNNEALRTDLERRGFAAMSQRDIRPYLLAALMGT